MKSLMRFAEQSAKALALIFMTIAMPGCAHGNGEADKLAPQTKPAAEARQRLIKAAVAVSNADLVLAGDSLIEGWHSDLLSPHTVLNLGVGGDETQNLSWRIQDYDLRHLRPKHTVLLIGTNNLPGNAASEIVAGIEQAAMLLRRKLPTARLAIILLLPRGEDLAQYDPKRRAVNDSIAGWAKQKGFVAIDVSREISCNYQMIACANYKPDHLHLTPAGYAVISKATLKAVRD